MTGRDGLPPGDDTAFDAVSSPPEGTGSGPVTGAAHHQDAQLWALSAEIRTLVARLGPLEEFHAAAAPVLDELESAAAAAQAAAEQLAAGQEVAPEDPVSPAEQHPAFDLERLVAWMRENVLGVLERTLPKNQPPNWCARWTEHPEAVGRLEAARRHWMEATADGQGSALWGFWQHLDYQLAVLQAPHGPFSRCRDGHADGPFTARLLPHVEPDSAVYADYERYLRLDLPSARDAAPPSPNGTGRQTLAGAGGRRASEHRAASISSARRRGR